MDGQVIILFIILIISIANNFFMYYKYNSHHNNAPHNTMEPKINLYYIKNGKNNMSFDEVRVIGSSESTVPRSSITESGSGVFTGNQTLDQIRAFFVR
jgi:hypothetical protein